MVERVACSATRVACPVVAPRPLVIAHRGASHRARENTIEAYEVARDLGADGVELDVRRSSDGVLIVHHDAEAPEIGLLAAQPFAGIRAALPWLPTLEEALDACAGWFVNVEIKCCAWEADADPEHVVARAAVDLARERDVQIVVSSFDVGNVDAVRAHAPGVQTALLVHSQDIETAAALARERGHEWLNPDKATVLAAPEKAVAVTRGAGLQLDVWTVDDPDEIRTLARAGVDAIITNEPDTALAALALD